MREHLTKFVAVGGAALLVGLVSGAGLGRADAGSARRYGDAVDDARVRELERRLAETSAERDRLRTENDTLSEQLRAAAPAVDLGGAVSRLETELTSARAQAKEAMARAEQELALAKTQAQRQVAEARASAERESARWRQSASDAQGQVEALRREVADLKQQIVVLNETIRTLRAFGR